MEHTFNPNPYSCPIYDSPLISVDRAITDLRKGRCVLLTSKDCLPIIVFAAETVTKSSIDMVHIYSGSTPLLGLTPSRAKSLRHANNNNEVLVLNCVSPITQNDLKLFTVPISEEAINRPNFKLFPLENDVCVKAGLKVAKLSSLLPVICFAFPRAIETEKI